MFADLGYWSILGLILGMVVGMLYSYLFLKE